MRERNMLNGEKLAEDGKANIEDSADSRRAVYCIYCVMSWLSFSAACL